VFYIIIIGGIDYEEVLQVLTTVDLTFDPARNRRSTESVNNLCANILLIPDELVEDEEYFLVELSTDDSGVILFPQNKTIFIANNDRKT